MAELPQLTYTDFNGNKQTFNPNYSGMFYRKTGAGNNVFNDPSVTASRLAQIDSLLDPNFSKNRRGYSTSQGDLHFRSLEDVDWEKFDDPELAKRTLTAYVDSAKAASQKLSEDIRSGDYARLRRDGGAPLIQRWQQMMGDAVAAGGMAADDTIKQLITETESIQRATLKGNEQNREDFLASAKQGGMTQVSPLDEDIEDAGTMNFLDWKQKYGGSYSDWKNARGEYKTSQETIGGTGEMRDVQRMPTQEEMAARGNEIAYPTWAEQQRATGKPSSYQDWLKAGKGATTDTTGMVDRDTGEPLNQTAEKTDLSTPDTTQTALDAMRNSEAYQRLSPEDKMFADLTVGSSSLGSNSDMDAIIGEWQRIADEKINPKFKEMADVYTADLLNQYDQIQLQRGEDLEKIRSAEGNNIRQARSSLEQRGMTFSGQGIEELGAKAAIGRPDGQSVIPTQTEVGANEDLTTKGGMTFEDGRFFEGNVNQANRLMSSAASRRYQENLRSLGRAAEDTLGGQKASELISGFTPAGVSTGSIEAQRKKELGDVLTSTIGKFDLSKAQNVPVTPNLTT